jgi:hypothetical protein
VHTSENRDQDDEACGGNCCASLETYTLDVLKKLPAQWTDSDKRYYKLMECLLVGPSPLLLAQIQAYKAN